MLCLVRYLCVISTSVIDCLGRFVPEMTYYVLSGTLNLTKLKLNGQLPGAQIWRGQCSRQIGDMSRDKLSAWGNF